MSMDVIELVLDVEQKYDIEIEESTETLGDLFLVLVYETQKKNCLAAPDSTVQDDDRQTANQPRIDDLFRQLNDASLTSTVASILEKARIIRTETPPRCLDGKPASNLPGDTSLEKLFPCGFRTFRWNRFRNQGKKQGWEIPGLRENTRINWFIHRTGIGALYCAIYVFLISFLVAFGLDRPLGDWGRTLFFVALAYLPVYLVLVFVLSTLEYCFGLYEFPENMKTVDDLSLRMKGLNFLKWAKETNAQEILQASMTDRQKEIWAWLKSRYADIYGIATDEVSFDSEL